MFGYVNIEKESLTDGQRGLNQTFMCGLCFSTKRRFGNLARMTIGNDVNFFNVLFHSFCNVDVETEKARCIAHPLTKRTVLKKTELCDKLACANVLLVYFNAFDDVADGGGWRKRAVLRALKRNFRKARQDWTTLADVLQKNCEDLRLLEKNNCTNLDEVCHPFAQLSKEFCRETVEANEYLLDLCYNVGKWIYLMDALDDVGKDLKKGNYNPIVACFGVKSVKDVQGCVGDLKFVLYSVLNRIASSYNDLNLTKYTCLLDNVIYRSMRNKTKQLLAKFEETRV